ncbi:solute carrier family 25 member 36-A-like [Clavelina lepadiformis]|uniref:solute carrier family 25 member 36-A-like n=1 Tax=Clavelina lepadiformis TaxID=159417 RepID=UPI00404260E7
MKSASYSANTTCSCSSNKQQIFASEYKSEEHLPRMFTNRNDGRWQMEHEQYESRKIVERGSDVRKVAKPEAKRGRFLHLFAGGLAGCASTLVTCPIDVIKTRQQASGKLSPYGSTVAVRGKHTPKTNIFRSLVLRSSLRAHYTGVLQPALLFQNSILQHTRYIWQVEGLRSFYKGLGPSLLGVVPSRALFFFAYETAKATLQNDVGFRPNSVEAHVLSSMFGGLVCTSATCPLWVLKTKQQLHRRLNKTSLSTAECMRRVWATEGFKGFYRGLTASYAGIVETVLYFTIYEQMKASYIRKHNLDLDGVNISMSTFWELPGLMVISSAAKCTATCIAYPHEVIRTRLREEPVKRKYNGFFQTLRAITAKEGLRGLYGGLPAQLVRQVPNMAILMGVYEGALYIARSH